MEKLFKSQTGEYRKVQRAKILLMSDNGMLNCEIVAAIGVHPNIAYNILASDEIEPNKINYYLVRKDPDFEAKMHDVLVVYKQAEMCFDDEDRLTIDIDAPKRSLYLMMKNQGFRR